MGYLKICTNPQQAFELIFCLVHGEKSIFSTTTSSQEVKKVINDSNDQINMESIFNLGYFLSSNLPIIHSTYMYAPIVMHIITGLIIGSI